MDLKSEQEGKTFKGFSSNVVKKSRQIVTLSRFPVLDKFTLIVCGWFIILPFPYEVLLLILVALPFIGIAVNGIEEPSITSLVSIRKNKTIDIADFIVLPTWTIMARVFFDYRIDSYSALAVSGSVLFGMIALAVLFTHSLKLSANFPRNVAVILLLIGNLALYSYSTVVALNCRFDYSEPLKYSVTVIDKSIIRIRRAEICYLKIRPWGPHKEVEDIRVDYYQYRDVEIGGQITIIYYEGLFGIRWYDVNRGFVLF